MNTELKLLLQLRQYRISNDNGECEEYIIADSVEEAIGKYMQKYPRCQRVSVDGEWYEVVTEYKVRRV